MYVILNSDVTFHPELVRRALNSRLVRLLEACREHGHTVVLPRTTVLEFRLQQELARTRKLAELAKARQVFAEFGIQYSPFSPEDAVETLGLNDLVGRQSVLIEVAEPTHQEMLSAHDRACMHAAPASRDAKSSDEMRDLVIWEVALRYARGGRALLVSRDMVHSGERGRDEAAEVGLLRARTIEDALEILQVETPARPVVLMMLAAAWDDLLRAGLPASAAPAVKRVRDPRFTQGTSGLEEATAVVQMSTPEGVDFDVEARISLHDMAIRRITMHSMADSPVSVQLDVKLDTQLTVPAPSISERLQDLREVLESE